MGYFSKKADPVSERARTLTNEIAALQAQIQRLSAQQEKTARKEARNGHPKERPPGGRTTRSGNPRPDAASAATETIFEEIAAKSVPGRAEKTAAAQFEELRTRQSDLPGTVRKLVKQLKGPPSSNPKLVNYLAAGSIEGLRPFRYEKRVARNRVVLMVVFLVLLLLGILTHFIRHG